MDDRMAPTVVRDVLTYGAWDEGPPETLKWLARLLRAEGVDLMTASFYELERGTPVYVEASADVGELQRRMAMSHIRRVPVLDDASLLGIVDLVELAMLGQEGSGAAGASD